MSGDDGTSICEAVRERAFEFRRESLTDDERRRVEAHLEACEACRDYVERVDSLLTSTRESEPAPEPVDSDALFDEITDEIEAREAGPAADEESGAEEERAEEEHPAVEPSRTRYVGVAAAALIAGLALGVVATWMLTGEGSSANTDRFARGGSDAGGPFADLRPIADASGDRGAGGRLQMYASSGAALEVTEGETVRIDLDRGRVLVDYAPDAERSLVVESPGFAVRVTGTVFYVSAEKEEPRAGVLAGSVEVVPDAGEAVAIESGEEVSATFERRRMPEARRESLASHIDVSSHRGEQRDEESAQSPTPEPSADVGVSEEAAPGGAARPSSGGGDESKPLEPSLESLRERASSAAADGEPRRAVNLYRKFLDRVPEGHPDGGAVRLDLAHLFVHRLDRPARAVPHLRAYLARWPDDVAAPAARDELCQITRSLEQFESDCD